MVMSMDRQDEGHLALKGCFLNDYYFVMILMEQAILSYRASKSQTLARLSVVMAVHQSAGEEYWLGDDVASMLLDLMGHLL
jgi:hypothetical protein